MKKLTLILALFIMCSVYAGNPPWADKKADQHFIYGVGMAFKQKAPRDVYKRTGKKYMNDYVQEAKDKALKDLVKKISGNMTIDSPYLTGFDVYKDHETKSEYWYSYRMPRKVAQKIAKKIRFDNSKDGLDKSKKDFEKTFDKEFEKN